MVLCRIYEEITMPPAHAGKVEGRSSFARLGLMVHCAADFINPGWRGHMPLELVNFNRNELRLPPFMPVCQLMLVRLDGKPDRLYGDTKLSSKYVEDDGGPSYWWRDELVSELLNDMGQRDLQTGVQEGILGELGTQPSAEVLVRLERFVGTLQVGDVNTSRLLLDRFAAKEDRTHRTHSLLRAVAKGVPPLAVAGALAAYLANNALLVIVAVVVLVLSAPASIYVWSTPQGSYLGRAELEDRRQASTVAAASE